MSPLRDQAKRREYFRAWKEKNAESQSKKRREWYHKNKHLQKDVRKWAHIQSRYGLTRRDYESMWLRQGGKCPVCDQIELNGKSMHIDHDHATGRVRGLLCGPCNRFIGLARENIHTLHGAADYLEMQSRIKCPL